MSSAAIRLAVFDCDGTLVDGQHDICAAMDAAFAAQGLPLPPGQVVRRVVGLSLPQAMRQLLPEAEPALHMALVADYKLAYRAARTEGRVAEPLFDGIRELLDGLRAGGWDLGVATGKSRRGLDHCLAVHGLHDHFVTLQTADDHPSKPHPAMLEAALDEVLALPGDAVMIGDTCYDIEMARAAGVRAIGVGWGYHAPEELLAAGAEAVATSPAELRELLR
jgi:phosphoglycolate phosphatase